MRRFRNTQPSPVSLEDAEQHFLFIEKTMYRMVLLVVPLVSVLALGAGNRLNGLTQTYMALIGLFVLLNGVVALNYFFRKHSLRAWLIFLFVPTLSVTGAVSGIMLFDMIRDDPARLSATLLRENAAILEIALALFFVTGLVSSVHGNRRSVRQAEFTAAFKQRALTRAQAAILMFFHEGKRPLGSAYYAMMGGVFVSVLSVMRFNNVTIWYELVPFVGFVALGCGTTLVLGTMVGFFAAVWPFFRKYGDIEIQRDWNRGR